MLDFFIISLGLSAFWFYFSMSFDVRDKLAFYLITRFYQQDIEKLDQFLVKKSAFKSLFISINFSLPVNIPLIHTSIKSLHNTVFHSTFIPFY